MLLGSVSLSYHAFGIFSKVSNNRKLHPTLIMGSGLLHYGRRGSLNSEVLPGLAEAISTLDAFATLTSWTRESGRNHCHSDTSKRVFAVTPRAIRSEAGIIEQPPYKGLAPRQALHLESFTLGNFLLQYSIPPSKFDFIKHVFVASRLQCFVRRAVPVTVAQVTEQCAHFSHATYRYRRPRFSPRFCVSTMRLH